MQSGKYIKYIGWFVIIVVVFLLGISIGTNYQSPETKLSGISSTARQLSQAQTVSVMIDYGNGKVETRRDLSVVATSTVFDVLKSADAQKNLNLGFKDYGKDMGVFIESIGGVGKDPDGKKWWQYWVNNAYSQVGASNYNVKPGDVIEFKFIQEQI